ncbi:hypothetical protein AKJ16_DCAP12188 [Drosera capensis]
MGKPEDELGRSSNGEGGDEGASSEGFMERGCGVVIRVLTLRCLLVVLFGIAVFLSALFWLPPFLDYADVDAPDLDPRFRGHEIVASFKIVKPVSLLQDNCEQLADEILDEIEVPNAKVVILSLETYGSNTNITSVVFGIDPEKKSAPISSAALSLIRASFESLIIRQSSLKLTASLFGEPYFFEVLRFPGGITVTPTQSAFLLQKVQVSFNFSLSFAIYQIQENFEELKSQLTHGVYLAPYENLYITLTNSRGSTFAPPTTVQAYVLMAVGIPSSRRLKQLAQTIKGSHGRNLGLNHTIFGKVKQVSLSSTLQHVLSGGDSGRSIRAPAPTPLLPSHHYHHHHHHHPHHHHHRHNRRDHDFFLAASSAPSPLPHNKPQPVRNSLPPRKAATPPAESAHARPPSCRFGLRKHHAAKSTRGSFKAPSVAPKASPSRSAALHHRKAKSPAPVIHSVPLSSPVPHVSLAHAYPRVGSSRDSGPSSLKDNVAPSPAPSGASRTCRVPGLLFTLITAFLLHP